ncbi:MAG: hypothetical protein ACQGQP_00070 [Desulfovibrio sp.]|nr:hypothetical protein [Mailhella sp.]
MKALLFAMAAIFGILPSASLGRTPEDGAVEDLSSRIAPKVIHSHDISDFNAAFEYHPSSSLPSRGGTYVSVEPEWPSGHYELRLSRSGGTSRFAASFQGNGLSFDVQKELPPSVLDDMQALIEKHGVARLNGFYKRDTALGCGFRLDVLYASGEKISAGAEGGSAVMPGRYWDEAWFLRFMSGTADRHGFTLLPRKDLSGALRSFAAVFPYRRDIDGGSFAEGEYKLELFSPDGEGPGGLMRISFKDPAGKETWTEARASREDFQDLADLLRKEGVARLDGYHYGGFAADQCDVRFRIEAEFDSGDVLRARAEGPAGVIPAASWNAGSLLEFFLAGLARRQQEPAP